PSVQTVVVGACTGSVTGSSGSGSASGSCQNAPACSGDSLHCSSLEQVWNSACEQTKANLDVTDEHINASNEQINEANDDLANAQDDANKKASDFFSDFQSKATASTSAQCIQDVNLAVMGKQLIVPFSKACDFFRFLRVLVIFSAYMLAARIVFGGLT
ncbi:MAG TPA: virulence factor TspB C-terminal domain-related protein, partial [Agitococcus sp.]|nr:virulence factor TspB C-terminal domain-related protein [Agitococcus sp.]